jgi:hypothetical protein
MESASSFGASAASHGVAKPDHGSAQSATVGGSRFERTPTVEGCRVASAPTVNDGTAVARIAEPNGSHGDDEGAVVLDARVTSLIEAAIYEPGCDR